ncbi:UDP-glucose--sterol glucosyltransferase [Arthrobacter sp. AFG7.2]|uniref:glycosyltransferase n=1 Tax=Arthrobacter sp. AFG7.2 TaxID=1688693 RepID=UPI000C9E7FCC|nr:glycosyltransferase [Arthrobacter sp. AFG7.2]PNI09754.1 UDP-glucose--sterol glucosyltransferase [Arthrobacter sp. AFG7.2]
MHVLMMSFGTRGDIQPYAALAGALARAGHDVTLAVAAGFADLVPQAGPGTISHRPAGSTMLRLLQEVMPGLSGPRDALRTLGIMTSAMRELNAECWAAAQAARPDVVVYHPKCLAGPHIAEALGVPGVLSLPLPFFTPTRAYPMPFFGGASFGGLGNRVSYVLRRMSGAIHGGMVNDFRREVGLGRTRRLADPLRNPDGSPVHVLYPYSRHVVPVPDDYPPSAHVTGYWFLDHSGDGEGWNPPAQLADFLAAGGPPVYVGFGSMGFGKGADDRRDAVLAALRVHGLRGIVATGWGGIAPGAAGTDDVLVVEGAPHEWLFPRVSAVVHHGGAGSTAAGIRAGRPTMVVPFLGDQPFWGTRVHALGVGPAPLPARHLGKGLTDRLGELIRTPSYASRAEEVGAAVRAENGLAAGVQVLEQITGGLAVH